MRTLVVPCRAAINAVILASATTHRARSGAAPVAHCTPSTSCPAEFL